MFGTILNQCSASISSQARKVTLLGTVEGQPKASAGAIAGGQTIRLGGSVKALIVKVFLPYVALSDIA